MAAACCCDDAARGSPLARTKRSTAELSSAQLGNESGTNCAFISCGLVASRARNRSRLASSWVTTFARFLRTVRSVPYPRRKNGTKVVSSWSSANPCSQRSTCSLVFTGQMIDGVETCPAPGPTPPPVSVPPAPPPTEAQPAAKAAANASPTVLISGFMIPSFTARQRSSIEWTRLPGRCPDHRRCTRCQGRNAYPARVTHAVDGPLSSLRTRQADG